MSAETRFHSHYSYLIIPLPLLIIWLFHQLRFQEALSKYMWCQWKECFRN